MAAFELPLVALLSASLALLPALGRRRHPPNWTILFGVGAIAWLVGAQGLLFRRYPDYMVAYLFEARGDSSILYLVWCAAMLGIAWIFTRLIERALRGDSPRLGAIFLVAGAIGMLAAPLAARLRLIGSTLEFREGLTRPLSFEPAARMLLMLTIIGSFLPMAGASLLMIADGLRARARRAGVSGNSR
jgi:hypothetical protein